MLGAADAKYERYSRLIMTGMRHGWVIPLRTENEAMYEILCFDSGPREGY